MDGSVFWVVGCLAAFCVGLGKGGVPVITATAVPMMSLVMSPVLAAGLLLPVYIVADMFGLYAYRRTFHARVLKIMMVAMPVGVLIGYMTSASIPEDAITIVIGLIGAAFALAMIVRKPVERTPKEARLKPGLFWGMITGFTSFVSHSGATPYQVYTLPLGMDKITFAGTVTIAFAYINLIKLIPYYALGQLSLENIKSAALLLVPAVIGVLVGVRLVRVMPEKLFFRIIVWALLLLSLRLIWDGTAGLLA
jgi:uncharacterized membrane protein YfcA